MALFLPVFTAALITMIQPRTASVRMEVRSGYSNVEDKALRAVRKGFGGYPAGPYYGLPPDAAYDLVRSDHAVLSEWSNEDIADTVADIKSTPLEILIDTPIGPFLFLSTIAIAQDGDGNLLVGIQKLFEPR